MIRIRGQEGYKRYDLLIDEQTVIGWDNLLRGKFPKQWKIQQKACATRRKLGNAFLYDKTQRRKKREAAKNATKTKQRRTTKQKTFMRSSMLLFLSLYNHTRNMDGQMHIQKHTSSRRKNSSSRI
jgi:hypothetical protein